MKWYRKGEKVSQSYAVYDASMDEINIIEKCDYIGMFYDEGTGEIYFMRCGYEDDGRFSCDGIIADDSNLICYTTEMELIWDAKKYIEEVPL